MNKIIGEISFLTSLNNGKLLLLNFNNTLPQTQCKLLEFRNNSFPSLINCNSRISKNYLLMIIKITKMHLALMQTNHSINRININNNNNDKNNSKLR